MLGLKENDVCYSVAKLFFAYGLGNAHDLSDGGRRDHRAARRTGRRPSGVAAILRQHPVTVFYAVPTFYAGFLASPDAPKRADLKLRCCVSAGEALPPDVGRRWQERYGVDILDGIGSTEMLHIFLSNYPGDVKYGTTGKPVPGYDIRLVDDDGNVIKTKGEMGELQVRGPTSAIMYWNNREQIARDLPGRMDALRRQISRGRGRLLRLLRAARRHAQGRRHLCLAVRGRRRALHPSRRAGGRGGGLAGRGRADQAEGLRGAQVGRQGLRRACARAAGARARARSRPTNIRAGSSFAPTCPRPRPARSSASSCGRKQREAEHFSEKWMPIKI